MYQANWNGIGYRFKSKVQLAEFLGENCLVLDENSKPELNLFWVKQLNELEFRNLMPKAQEKPLKRLPTLKNIYEFKKGKGYKVIKLRPLKKNFN
jgi:hypothetical protein